MRRLVVATVLVGACAVLVARVEPQRWRTLAHLAVAPTPAWLPVPVAGVRPAALTDSFGAPRAAGRRHRGIDIFAKRGTPVVAPVAGIVLRVGQNRLGGNVVTVLGPGRQVHYFAHLDRFGRFRAGDVVRPGDVLGFVGTSGNARGTPPHLHYGIYAAPGAINPYPVLTAPIPVASDASSCDTGPTRWVASILLRIGWCGAGSQKEVTREHAGRAAMVPRPPLLVHGPGADLSRGRAVRERSLVPRPS